MCICVHIRMGCRAVLRPSLFLPRDDGAGDTVLVVWWAAVQALRRAPGSVVGAPAELQLAAGAGGDAGGPPTCGETATHWVVPVDPPDVAVGYLEQVLSRDSCFWLFRFSMVSISFWVVLLEVSAKPCFGCLHDFWGFLPQHSQAEPGRLGMEGR